MGKKYEELHKLSRENPDKFWGDIAEEVFWYKKWDNVLDDSNSPFFRWFTGGVTNTCANAIDRWIGKTGEEELPDKSDQPAYIWESPDLGLSRTITYKQLYEEVNEFAGVLKNSGVGKGDRVIIYMPMIPEACVAALACSRIGAIHSIVFAGFSRDSLAFRIDDAKPKLLICADAGYRAGKAVPLKGIVDDALDMASHKPELVIIKDRGLAKPNIVEGRDVFWKDILKEKGEDFVECEKMESTDPLYILYTSGTTGKPKGVLRDTGGHLVALYHSMGSIYDVRDKDVYWAASDIGWVVGHSYIIYGPLFKGLTSIIYEGTPIHPDAGVWFRVIEKYKVNCLFTSPTAFRILKKYPEKDVFGADLSSLRAIFLAGEPLDAPTYKWATKATGNKPIVDHYWQTETGWAILAGHLGTEKVITEETESLPENGFKIKPGSPTWPSWGWELKIVDEEGNEKPAGEKGYLVAMPPTPPGVLLTVYGNDERYIDSYYNDKKFEDNIVYTTGDYAIIDEDGYYYVLGRADEVIKVAGHRLGTREIEEAISSHESVAEVCTIGVADEEKGSVPVAMVVLKPKYDGNDELKKAINNIVRKNVGPIASLHRIEFVTKLPKTRSGKIIRRVIKNLFEDKDVGDLSTIEDPSAVDVVRKAIQGK
ncbi:MAG: acetate--CoA ligase [Candidatus Lokiarchaeota archaeon]|nr:acetate--CoA ligase [Candidatus Lokiarchaeota archaeon]